MRKSCPHIIFLFLILIPGSKSNSQLVSGNAFLQGNYIRLGLAPNAAFGSTINAPAGMLPPNADLRNSPVCNLGKLGFVADVGKDGWTNGIPAFIGDYFLPGTPEEGWALSFDGIDYNNNRSPGFIPGFSDQCVGGSQVNGAFINFTDLPDRQEADWEGIFKSLHIEKKITLMKNKLYFITEITLTNQSPVTMTNIYYMRNVDPDNEVGQAGPAAHATINSIEFQNPSPSNKALVSAKGSFYNSYLGLGSIDCRARVCISGGSSNLANRSPIDVYNGTSPRYSTLGLSITQDMAIALAFKLGNLAPGESVHFAFAYILLQEDLEEALNKTAPQFDVNGQIVSTGGGVYDCTGTSLPINITPPGNYSWTWSPATGLNTTSGSSVIYSPQPNTITYTVSAPDPFCGTTTLKLTVYPPSQALTQFAVNTICANKTVGFTNQSATLAEPATSYHWDFGDGQTSTLVSPTHTYTNFGVYNVKLSVITSTLSCAMDTTMTKSVSVVDGAIPVINYSNNACVGRPVNINGSISTSPQDISAQLWTITGGTTYSTQNINHTFNTPGVYDVSYQVSTNSGCVTQATKTINVETDPQVSFNASNGCVNKSLIFTNSSSNIFGPISLYNWDFGNNQTSNLQSPVQSYAAGGNYNVQLTAQTANGCSSVFSKIINIESIPQANFTYATACPGTPVNFNNLSSISFGTIQSYEWNFDNGSSSILVNPTTIFNQDRNYQVSLKATTSNGCESLPKVVVILIRSPNTWAGKDTIVFKDAPFRLKAKGGVSYVWSPAGYLDNPNLMNPVAKISNDQVFTVQATDERGCKANDEVKISVFVNDDIYVPTSFSPNNDGKNDVFRPIAPPGVVKLFEVFNRWGEKIFSTADPQSGWNGKLYSAEQPSGIYVWFLKATTRKGEYVEKKGTLMLLR